MIILSSALVALFYALICILLGTWLLGATDTPAQSPKVSLRFILGQILLGSLWMLLGIGRQFSSGIVLAILTIVLLVTLFRARTAALHVFQSGFTRLTQVFQDNPLLASLLLLTGTTYGLSALLLPLRFGSGDGFFYYMITPRMLAEFGELLPAVGREGSMQRGLLSEMSYAVMLLFSGEHAAAFLAWLTGLASMAIVFDLALQAKASTRAALLVIVLFLSSSGFYLFFNDGKVEMFALAYALAGVWMVFNLDPQRLSIRACAAAGAFCVASALGKPAFAITAIGIGVVFGWQLLRAIYHGAIENQIAEQLKRVVLVSAVLGVASLLTLLPHSIKNDLWYRSPLSPFARVSSVLPQTLRSQELQNRFQIYPDLVPDPPSHDAPVVAPEGGFERIKWFTVETTDTEIVAQYWAQLTYIQQGFQIGRISPLLLGLLPFLFTIRGKSWRKHRLALLLATFGILSIVYYVRRFVFLVSVRTLLPSLVLLFPLFAILADKLWRKVDHLPLSNVIVTGVIAFTLLGYSNFDQEFARFQQVYVENDPACANGNVDGIAFCEISQYLNAHAPEGARVANITYPWWLRQDLFACLPSTYERRTYDDNWELLINRGFTYYVEDIGMEERSAQFEIPDGLNIEVVFENSKRRIYHLQLDAPIETETVCAPDTSGAWEITFMDSATQ